MRVSQNSDRKKNRNTNYHRKLAKMGIYSFKWHPVCSIVLVVTLQIVACNSNNTSKYVYHVNFPPHILAPLRADNHNETSPFLISKEVDCHSQPILYHRHHLFLELSPGRHHRYTWRQQTERAVCDSEVLQC